VVHPLARKTSIGTTTSARSRRPLENAHILVSSEAIGRKRGIDLTLSGVKPTRREALQGTYASSQSGVRTDVPCELRAIAGREPRRYDGLSAVPRRSSP